MSSSGDGGRGNERLPRGFSRRPREIMVITPLLAGLGGLIAFFTVVFVVVILPVTTYDPPPSGDWAPLSDSALAGRNLFAMNNCYVCHSGYSRPQDVRYQNYFLYPKISQPGDFYGSDQSPNLLGTERTGPDLSQEGGWHPDDWENAHLYDARYTTPYSLMPPFKTEFSNKQVQELTDFVEQRSGKSGLLRYAGQLYAKHVNLMSQGYPPPPVGYEGANQPIVEGKDVSPPEGQLEEAVNLSLIDRSYWLSGDPLPVTESNLLRGKQVFLQRCVGCHGLAGDGKGPAAPFMSPPPADFTDPDDACCGGDTGPGDFYFRILRGWPGTAMENFGDRLSVNDIWRVVLFLKTIPNGTLDSGVIPTPSDYIVWTPPDELQAWIQEKQPLSDNASFGEPETDPFLKEAEIVFPGLAPGDSITVPGIPTPLSLDNAAAGIRETYQKLLDDAWADAKARGDKLPAESQKAIPPEVPTE
jgi:cytochrome c oxidase cbb3-type subunit 2